MIFKCSGIIKIYLYKEKNGYFLKKAPFVKGNGKEVIAEEEDACERKDSKRYEAWK